MLQAVLGLDAARIASAFLVSPVAMGQRLVRAKAKIKRAGVPFAVPQPEQLPARLEAVLDAIHAAYGTGWDDPAGRDERRRGLTAEALRLAPHSRGSLTVDPEDPSGPPLIDPGFLSDARDVAALRAGPAITRDLARRPAVTPFGLTEIVPGDALRDADEETFVRQAAGSFFHPVGTCALGDGPESVVDRELLVRGTHNLRVADASVIPRIPAVATSATAQMIGWRLAERLLGPG